MSKDLPKYHEEHNFYQRHDQAAQNQRPQAAADSWNSENDRPIDWQSEGKSACVGPR
jgi:hypothetical protein